MNEAPPKSPSAEAPEAGSVKDTLVKAMKPKPKLDEDQIQDALAWFHEAEGDPEAEAEPVEFKLNMGSKDDPSWIRWVIGPVADTRITAIREASRKGGNRRQRRANNADAEVDEMLVARKMVVEGTIEPNLRDLAKGMSLVDPTDALDAFFRKAGKTGLITQLSGEILSISGWDDEDIQEVEAARG